MRSFWNLLMLLVFVSVPLTLTGCSGQVSQDNADQYEEAHPGDDDEEGDTEEESQD